ncbi:MAG TPA: sigma-54-dependent Fis family transcriptional regulator [Clostridiales bacterium]|jgi:transcriptional regulator with PAS, ATPase and Fis domain|nr:sigma-54-dependent Fis family transcriptional regulator [Clostridiales bacterium]
MIKRSLLSFYEKIVDTFMGNIIITDKEGIVIYAKKHNKSNLKLTENQILGKSMFHLEEEGLFKNTATTQALIHKKTTFRYVQGSLNTPLMTTAVPVFDNNGELEMVIAYSQEEHFMKEITEKFEEDRQKYYQLANYLLDKKTTTSSIVAESRQIKNLFNLMNKLSANDTTVLLTGESGTGKEVFARYIHNNSERKNSIFIPVNCSAIPTELMESEFFGYTKGSFTGASKDGKAGFFEIADQGTLFLDEIGELPLSLQSKLLRVLETGEFRKVGSNQVYYSKARIISATNKNLFNMVNEGQFREDLFYRLNILPIEIPPLRERLDDIKPLAELFLSQFNKKYRTEKKLNDEVIHSLENYSWPGNIRELKNIIERLVITSNTDILDLQSINIQKNNQVSETEDKISIESDMKREELEIKPLRHAVKEFEKKYILKTIKVYNDNMLQVSKVLGMHKSGLYRKLEEYRRVDNNDNLR